eukprot:7358415-Lingulodinium_polyedra.AAC.1
MQWVARDFNRSADAIAKKALAERCSGRWIGTEMPGPGMLCWAHSDGAFCQASGEGAAGYIIRALDLRAAGGPS